MGVSGTGPANPDEPGPRVIQMLGRWVWLPGRELRVGGGCDQVRGRRLVDEPDDRTVDVDADAPIGRAARAGDQVGASRGEVENDVFIDLPLVEALVDRLLRPLTELGVPERAVCVGVSRVLEGWKVAEHVQKVTAIPQRVDQRGVGGRGVLSGVSVKSDVLETLRLRAVRACLAVDETEQPLASRAGEGVPTVVGGVGERTALTRAPRDAAPRVACRGAQG